MGDPEGIIEWISEEAEAFDEILSDSSDFCVFAGARGVAAILEKSGCEHVKAATQTEAVFTLENTKDPSAEATLMGGKFYSDIWMKGDRELANEAIKKNEKESHEAREEAKRAEEAAERAKRIAELSPPPEVDPAMKAALETIRIGEEAIDEAVTKLLNEAAEIFLKED
ncbi:uncharacterized protein [Zea mays]|uniref:uncharacterized protein n=1 Tax=Zea mays TaxID=4577 RepID=UPI0004DE95FC|nr:uncharacterized protein LOC103638418 [Zea mays]|eukprot:XP_008659562.1 uncharacterized protein LOC103638418 [Zea mays]